jgi:hypothetical protein
MLVTALSHPAGPTAAESLSSLGEIAALEGLGGADAAADRGTGDEVGRDPDSDSLAEGT